MAGNAPRNGTAPNADTVVASPQETGEADARIQLARNFARQGRLQAAEAALSSILPATPASLLELGKLCIQQGQVGAAARLLRQAEDLLRRESSTTAARRLPEQSLLIEVLATSGRLLLREGHVLDALPRLQEALELGAPPSVGAMFARGLAQIRFTKPRSDLKTFFVTAFKETWIPPSDLMRSAISLLLLEPPFAEAFEGTDRTPPGSDEGLNAPALYGIASDTLLLELLYAGPIIDARLEGILVVLRKKILQAVLANEASAEIDTILGPFSSALGSQCLCNDYAFPWTDEEAEGVQQLVQRVLALSELERHIDGIDVAILACYRPLHALSVRDHLLSRSWPAFLESLLTRQLREPALELELKKTVPRITDIRDEVSAIVRNQYEESPYPRWERIPTAHDPNRFRNLIRASLSRGSALQNSIDDPARILIAGCGTGQESVAFGLQFPNSQILAVDLSMASLGYASRKTGEYGVRNIRYAQADLLELRKMEDSFDLIVCAGVLHHIHDPFAGLEILISLTRPGGYLMIALYSKLGRRDIDLISAFARRSGCGPDVDDLRRLRQEILGLHASDPVRISALSRDDFYSLNMLRDMAFHVHEHRFDIDEINRFVRGSSVEFCGFMVPDEVRRGFISQFGPDLLSLDNWKVFEEKYPQTFSGMYHFFLKKPLAE